MRGWVHTGIRVCKVSAVQMNKYFVRIRFRRVRESTRWKRIYPPCTLVWRGLRVRAHVSTHACGGHSVVRRERVFIHFVITGCFNYSGCETPSVTCANAWPLTFVTPQSSWNWPVIVICLRRVCDAFNLKTIFYLNSCVFRWLYRSCMCVSRCCTSIIYASICSVRESVTFVLHRVFILRFVF